MYLVKYFVFEGRSKFDCEKVYIMLLINIICFKFSDIN